MRKIEQSWWHIQDQLNPSKGRIFRQIMDIYTDEKFFEIPLGKFNFVKLKVLNRNNHHELSYLEDDKKIIVNLGNLNQWPLSNKYHNVRHVKIEIKYTILEPKIKKTWKRLFNIQDRVYYTGSFFINRLIQPEFYITMPRGLRLKDKGNSSTMLFGVAFKNKKLKEQIDSSMLERVYNNGKTLISVYKMKYNVHIDKMDKKESYSYLVDTEEYKILKKYRKELEKLPSFFGFYYNATYDRKILSTIVILGIIISLIVFVRIYYLTNGGDGTFTVPFVIFFISYVALILKYHDEEYNLPLMPIILIMAIIFLIWILSEILFLKPTP